MPTSMATTDSRPHRPARPDAGFTLTELMVVIVLIGIAAAAVVLTIPPPGGGARAEAVRLAARVAAMRDRAVIEGRGYSLWITASGYGFERRASTGWEPVADNRLAQADWRGGTEVSVNGAAQGRIAFDRLGIPDHGLAVRLAEGSSHAALTISAAGDVEVE